MRIGEIKDVKYPIGLLPVRRRMLIAIRLATFQYIVSNRTIDDSFFSEDHIDKTNGKPNARVAPNL